MDQGGAQHSQSSKTAETGGEGLIIHQNHCPVCALVYLPIQMRPAPFGLLDQKQLGSMGLKGQNRLPARMLNPLPLRSCGLVKGFCRADRTGRWQQAGDTPGCHSSSCQAYSQGRTRHAEILTAAELLNNAAEHGGPIEFARIATLQAINRHVGRVFDPSRKDQHWGRRKLKRDEL